MYSQFIGDRSLIFASPSCCPSLPPSPNHPPTHMWLSQARMLLPIVNVRGIIYTRVFVCTCLCARVSSLPSTLFPLPSLFEIDTDKGFGAGRQLRINVNRFIRLRTSSRRGVSEISRDESRATDFPTTMILSTTMHGYSDRVDRSISQPILWIPRLNAVLYICTWKGIVEFMGMEHVLEDRSLTQPRLALVVYNARVFEVSRFKGRALKAVGIVQRLVNLSALNPQTLEFSNFMDL